MKPVCFNYKRYEELCERVVWRPVEYGFPTLSGEYIVSGLNCGSRESGCAYFNALNGKWSETMISVEAWMEIPEPYEPDCEEE